MPTHVILLDAARHDRRRIRAWFRQPGAGELAKRHLERLEAAITALPDTPFAGRVGPLANTRVLVSQGHRVIYRVLSEPGGTSVSIIVVLRIYGPGQSAD